MWKHGKDDSKWEFWKSTTMCLCTIVHFWLRNTSMIVKTFQWSFHVFKCAFHLEISSFFRLEFPLSFPIFNIWKLLQFCPTWYDLAFPNFHSIVLFFVTLKLWSCKFYQYKRKTWKSRMIKNMLKRRKESNTYLATVSRHRRSRQITMKIDKLL